MLVVCVVALLGLICLKTGILREHFMYPDDTDDYDTGAPSQEPPEDEKTTHSILKDIPEQEFLNIESRKCKHVLDNPENGQKLDILKNYRLINHPTDDQACYFKMNDTLVDGKCSKYNDKLYDATYEDTVSTISPEKLNDPYIADTLTDNVCKISFKGDSTDKRRESYAFTLDENDPKVRKIHAAIAGVKATNDALVVKYNETKGTIKNLNEVVIPDRNNQIKELDRQMSVKDAERREWEARKKEFNDVDNSVAQAMYNRDTNSAVTVCRDYDVTNCVNLKMGEFPRGVMEAHGMQNDRMSSIRVPANMNVGLFNDDWYTGKQKIINSAGDIGHFDRVNWDNTGDKMNDQVTSVKIYPSRMFQRWY
jgi:hypothetical protein